MKDYRPQLRRLLKQPRWKIVLFTLVVHALLLWQTVTAPRAHWVGAQITKPHRLAFTALFVTLLVGLIKTPDVQTALYWSIAWGSIFSFFVTYRSIALILEHTFQKHPHQWHQN